MSNVNIETLNTRFKNKVVSFGTNNDSTLAIKNPVFELQLDKLFIVGLVPQGATTNDWAQDRPCALLWKVVSDYIIFETEKQYATLMEKSIVE